MITLRSVRLPFAGWQEVERGQDSVTMSNDRGEVVVVNVFPVPPDLPPLGDIEAVRDTYRTTLGDFGGLVSVDVRRINGLDAVRTLFKVGIPHQDRGRAYMGGLTFPFRSCSLVIHVQCIEQGMTGLREAAVLTVLMNEGMQFAADESGVMQGWASDPYRPQAHSAFLRNHADDERWDASFPDHPLSRVRAHLRDLEGLQLEPHVYDEPKF